MSRKKSDGISYFPLDTDFFTDPRIQRLAANFGADGPLFYIYILTRAYKEGYAAKYDEDFDEDAALTLHCSLEKIGLMLHYLLKKSLLDSTLFDEVKVLSSHGIQAQYQSIVKSRKRDVEVDGSSWILDAAETEGFVKVRLPSNKSEKKAINPGEMAINPGEMDKGKGKGKGKVKETKERGESASRFAPPTLEEVTAYCKERGSPVDPKKFYDFFSTPDCNGRTWIDSKGNHVRNWKQKLLTWESREKKTEPKAAAAPVESEADTIKQMQRMYQCMQKQGPEGAHN